MATGIEQIGGSSSSTSLPASASSIPTPNKIQKKITSSIVQKKDVERVTKNHSNSFKSNGVNSDKQIGLVQRIKAAALGSVAVALTVTPFEVAKIRMQMSQSEGAVHDLTQPKSSPATPAVKVNESAGKPNVTNANTRTSINHENHVAHPALEKQNSGSTNNVLNNQKALRGRMAYVFHNGLTEHYLTISHVNLQ